MPHYFSGSHRLIHSKASHFGGIHVESPLLPISVREYSILEEENDLQSNPSTVTNLKQVKTSQSEEELPSPSVLSLSCPCLNLTPWASASAG